MHSLARFHGTLCMPSSLAVPSFWSGTPALQLATRPIVSLQLPQRLCRGTGWHFCQEQLFTLLSFQKWLDFKRKNNVLIFRWPNERKWWHGSLESLNNRCIERECTSGRGEKTHLSTKTGATSRCFTSRLLSPLFLSLETVSVKVILLKHRLREISLLPSSLKPNPDSWACIQRPHNLQLTI